MPALVMSANYNADSKLLRRTASKLGWETLRLDGDAIPEDFVNPDGKVALYFAGPPALRIAGQLRLVLLSCDAGWLTRLPEHFTRRKIHLMSLAEACRDKTKRFVKLAVGKGFSADIYTGRSLSQKTSGVHPETQVLVAEPVKWEVEYRCFMLDKTVVTLSPYLRNGQLIACSNELLDAHRSESVAAMEFANQVIQDNGVEAPPAMVLDVGIIQGRGWAVIESNEPWAAGLYSCDPGNVLQVILRTCVPADRALIEQHRWGYHVHYSKARPTSEW